MNKRILPVLVIAVAGAILIISILIFLTWDRDTVLEFSFRDRVSESWVWDTTVVFQDKIIRSYYQTDGGIKTYRFTDLKSGEWELTLSAPFYKTETIPITIKKGLNSIEHPIELIGLTIPGLERFIIFETVSGNRLLFELRPVNSAGESVGEHPCLDIRILAVISEQMKDGLIASREEDSGSYRGSAVYTGPLEWSWDSGFDSIFRYSAELPLSRIKETRAAFFIIDYLIIVPNPEELEGEKMDEIINVLSQFQKQEEMAAYLNSFNSSLSYYFNTSWNVKGGTF